MLAALGSTLSMVKVYLKCKPSQIAQSITGVNLDKAWRRNYLRTRRIGLALSLFPDFRFLSRVLGFLRINLSYSVTRAIYSEKAFRKHRKQSDFSKNLISGGATHFGSGYGYENTEEDLEVALFYKSEFNSGKFSARETPAINNLVLDKLTRILGEEHGGITRVVNFGACYAYLDALLAKNFPQIEFVGIDRAETIKDLNSKDFARIQNIKFAADDILNWVTSQDTMSGTLFFSVRTQVLLPRDFLIEMYELLGSKNCSQILVFEPYGLSRVTNDLPIGGENLTSSLLYRDTMYLHNYQGIGRLSGFSISDHLYVKTQHQDEDYRIEFVHFVGSPQSSPSPDDSGD